MPLRVALNGFLLPQLAPDNNPAFREYIRSNLEERKWILDSKAAA